MAKEIRRYELVEATTDEEAGKMKQQMRIEEAQRLRLSRQLSGARKPPMSGNQESRAARPADV